MEISVPMKNFSPSEKISYPEKFSATSEKNIDTLKISQSPRKKLAPLKNISHPEKYHPPEKISPPPPRKILTPGKNLLSPEKKP